MICFETKNIEVWETKMTSCRSILQTKKFQMKSMGRKVAILVSYQHQVNIPKRPCQPPTARDTQSTFIFEKQM